MLRKTNDQLADKSCKLLEKAEKKQLEPSLDGSHETENRPVFLWEHYCFERNTSLKEGSLHHTETQRKHNHEFLRQDQEKLAARIKLNRSGFVDGKRGFR